MIMANRYVAATWPLASAASAFETGSDKSLMAVTDELSAPDDRHVVFQLKKPFPHLAQALGGSTIIMPCIMPERLATTDPFKALTEVMGSGPFSFVADEFDAGTGRPGCWAGAPLCRLLH
jgi:ABC-type transport system substrate-binding protein